MRCSPPSGHKYKELLLALHRQAAKGDAGIHTLVGAAVIMPAGHDAVPVVIGKLKLHHLPPASVIEETRCLALSELHLLATPSIFMMALRMSFPISWMRKAKSPNQRW